MAQIATTTPTDARNDGTTAQITTTAPTPAHEPTPIESTYEEKLERIRTIVNLVQNGATLAETLSLAKEGAELASACTEELDKAEAELANVFSNHPRDSAGSQAVS